MHTCIPTKALWLMFSLHTVGMFVRKEIHKQNLGIHFHYSVSYTVPRAYSHDVDMYNYCPPVRLQTPLKVSFIHCEYSQQIGMLCKLFPGN